MTHDRARPDCRVFRELAVWHPTDALTADERRRLQEHLADCPSCRQLAEYASRFRDHLREAADHPDPDELVAFAEDDPQLPDETRDRVREHVDACAPCRDLLRILTQVGDDLLLGPAAILGRVQKVGKGGTSGRVVRWLRPAAAAAVAAAATALLLLGRQPAPLVDGVHLLSGGGSGVRSPQPAEVEAVRFRAAAQQILVLEFTDLAAPPAADALYRVAISGEDGRMVWQQDVRGGLFRENYTLALLLPAGALDPGGYLLAVLAPDASAILRSRVAVE